MGNILEIISNKISKNLKYGMTGEITKYEKVLEYNSIIDLRVLRVLRGIFNMAHSKHGR